VRIIDNNTRAVQLTSLCLNQVFTKKRLGLASAAAL